MKVAVIKKPEDLVIQDVPKPEVGDYDVLIKIAACGICGTDVHIYKGEYLGDYPVIPGHEFAGTIEEVGCKTTRFMVGDRVVIEPNIACDNCSACLNNRQNFCENWNGIGVTLSGGMAEYVAVPEKAVFSVGDLPFEDAAFVEPLSCVLHGVERANFRLADKVLIIGAGPIGILLAQTIMLKGAHEITQIDKNKTRLILAEFCGVKRTFSSLDDLSENDFDVVVDATGVPALMEKTLQYARKGGTILLFGVPPNGKTITLPAFTIFQHGLTILSSYTSVRNSLQAVRLLSSGRIDVSKLVSHKLSLEDFEKGLKMVHDSAEGVLKILITP